jgi:hypothetical protein
MGKYAKNCVTMFLRHDNPPWAGRSDTFIFGNDPRECGQQAFKDATHFVRIHTVTGNHMLMNGYPKGFQKEITTYPDGHTGGPFPKIHRKADNLMFFFGTDPNNLNDLGAHVEFHIGKGQDEEVFEFDEPRCIFIPQGVYHGPLYVTKFHRNFIVFDIHTAPNRKACEDVDDFDYIGDDKKIQEVMGGLTPDLIKKFYTEPNPLAKRTIYNKSKDR